MALVDELTAYAAKACDMFVPAPQHARGHMCAGCRLSLGRHLAKRAAWAIVTLESTSETHLAAMREIALNRPEQHGMSASEYAERYLELAKLAKE